MDTKVMVIVCAAAILIGFVCSWIERNVGFFAALVACLLISWVTLALLVSMGVIHA